MTPSAFRTLEAAAEAVVPTGGPYPLGAREVEAAKRIDAMMATEDPVAVEQLEGALTALEWITVFRYGRRYASLPLDKRIAALEELLESRFALLRRVGGGVTKLVLFATYNADAMWPHLGYDGPWVLRVEPGAQ